MHIYICIRICKYVHVSSGTESVMFMIYKVVMYCMYVYMCMCTYIYIYILNIFHLSIATVFFSLKSPEVKVV